MHVTLGDEPHETREDQEVQRTPELTLDSLLKLSNVVRYRAYIALRAFGSLRARQIAELAGVAETSMNRHLDVLEEIGFVTPERRGKTRQSWVWSAVPGGIRIGRLEGGDLQHAALEWGRAVSGSYGIAVSQWPIVAPDWPQPWQSAAEVTDWVLHLTADQLELLGQELHNVMLKWKAESAGNEEQREIQTVGRDDPEWISPVLVFINAIPYPHRPS